MNDKKRKILETGMKIVAIKGYHATSIQEIANEAGVSKGTFYIYFHSKEEFITTVFQYFFDQITSGFNNVQMEKHPPRKKLEIQINVLSNIVYQYKDVITLVLRENISIGENADKLINQVKTGMFQWMRENIENIYKEKANDVLADAIIQLEGILHSYLNWIVIYDVPVERERLGSFVLRRMDDIINGMLERKEEPLTRMDHIPALFQADESIDERLQDVLLEVERKVETLAIDPSKRRQLQEVIKAMEREAEKEEKQPVVLQGLLAHFSRIPELQEASSQLADLLNVELLD
ncbi:TetR/AcrR family transcriptional regulator [Virgibacillus ainsalahensis]